MKYAVVIPAAGQGKRMGAGHNKQFLMLEDRPLIIHTVSVFEKDPNCINIIVVANPSEITDMRVLFDKWNIKKVTHVLAGGKERQDSVYEGLKVLKEEDIVLIHDGARPFIEASRLKDLVQKASETGAAVLGVRMKDTVKRAADGLVIETIERSSLWAVQTPQAFRLPIVLEAYRRAEEQQIVGTDDTSLVEKMGHPVHIVEGGYDNIKLTTPEDMITAIGILQKRRGE